MLINAHNSALMLIDVQEKLMPLVIEAPAVEANCRWLLQIAQYLKIPILTTEQYPKGLGQTVEPLREFSPAEQCLAKVAFSGLAEPTIADRVRETSRGQWVLMGIETHVCVLQTAMQLRAQGKEVFVVEDCTSARDQHDKTIALERMKQHGISIVTREMVVFEWLTQAGTAEFKHISEAFIK